MNNQEKIERDIAISDLADKFVDDAVKNGEPFTEGLCIWAINKAEREYIPPNKSRCKICKQTISYGELCANCSKGNDPFFTCDNCGQDYKR